MSVGLAPFYPDTADLDSDNDMDMIIGDHSGDIWIIENTGTSTNPIFDPNSAKKCSRSWTN